MATYYVDNNKTIYAADNDLEINISSTGSSRQLALGLGTFPELSGQSTVYVNKVMASFKGYGHSGGVNHGHGTFTVGVVPTDTLSTVSYEGYAAFQDYKAWPLKNGLVYYYCYTADPANSMNRVSLSFTYSPRKALVLNREQSIVLNINNVYGVNITGLLSLRLQLKRCG